MGPFMVIFLGMSLVTVPEAPGVLRRSPRHLPLFCVLVSAGLAVLALAWGVVLLVALPRGLGHLLLGKRCGGRPTRWCCRSRSPSWAGACRPAPAGLHALGAARRSLRAMILFSVLYIVCGLGGAAADGVMGTMLGAAVASWIGALLFWWQLRAALRNKSTPGQGLPGQPGRAAAQADAGPRSR